MSTFTIPNPTLPLIDQLRDVKRQVQADRRLLGSEALIKWLLSNGVYKEAFADDLTKLRQDDQPKPKCCPHCGQTLP